MAKKTFTEKAVTKITDGLSHYLADTFLLYVKTFNLHWNLVGPQFYMYHRLFEEQYKEMAGAIDEIAERIRMLGRVAPATLGEYLKLSCFKEEAASIVDESRIMDLVSMHLVLEEQGLALITITDAANDQGTSDLIIERVRFHSKQAWLLRSHLEKA